MGIQNQLLASHLVSDLFTYCTDGVGFNLYEQPHRKMCGVYQRALPPPPPQHKDARQKYVMTLWPRETLKTSIGCQSAAEFYALEQKVLYGYDARILIVRSAREAAVSVLGAVEQDLSTINPVLQNAFGDLSRESPEWSENACTLNWRTVAYREPTFDTAATGVSRTGYHYDLIIVDDIANENNYESEVEMAKARRYITALIPILNAWGTLLVIGTRWGFNDPYGAIIDFNEREIREGREPLWDIHLSGYRNEDGTLFYPAYLTEEKVQEKRRVMYAMTGSDKLWMASYLNVVSTDESAVFKKAEQQYYAGEYSPRGELPAELRIHSGSLRGNVTAVECAIHVDPAVSTTGKANKTGITVVLTDSKNRYVHDSWGGKELPADIVARVIALARYYRPYTISIDVWGQQVLWVDRLRTALDEADLHDVTITQYRGLGKPGHGPLSKEKRIESLGLLFREHTIFLHEGRVGAVVHELDTYNGVTASNHFDVLDSLSHTMHISKAPRVRQYSEDLESAEYDIEFDDDEPAGEPQKAHGHAFYKAPRAKRRDFFGCPHGLHANLCFQCIHGTV